MFTVASSPPISGQSCHNAFPSPANIINSPPRYRNNSFAPLTPSPLRESRNVQNLQFTTTHSYATPPQPSWFSSPMSNSENLGNANASSSPASKTWTSTPNTSSSNPSTFTSPLESSARYKSPSTFAQRARAQSPQALLNRTASASAAARRSLFVSDRARRAARDDVKSEVREEQHMRLEWMRERREWEERMRRVASRDAAITDSELANLEDLMVTLQEDADSMPPPDEEQPEMDMDVYMPEEYMQESPPPPPPPQQRIQAESSDDEDYDRLFMDVLSQNSPGIDDLGWRSEPARGLTPPGHQRQPPPPSQSLDQEHRLRDRVQNYPIKEHAPGRIQEDASRLETQVEQMDIEMS